MRQEQCRNYALFEITLIVAHLLNGICCMLGKAPLPVVAMDIMGHIVFLLVISKIGIPLL